MFVALCLGLLIILAGSLILGTHRLSPRAVKGGERGELDTASLDPDSMDLEEWQELLRDNPDNKELWESELGRARRFGQRLSEVRAGTASDKLKIDLSIANNLQITGIALSHLKRNPEAIQELSKSQGILTPLRRQYACDDGSRPAECKEIESMLARTLALAASYYDKINDYPNTEKHLKLAVVVSSNDPDRYGRALAALTLWYASRSGFDRALDAVLKEAEAAIASRAPSRLGAAAEAADRLYAELFYSISWEPVTSNLREHDPRDFVDMFGIGIGRDMKYGMTDKYEDEATFGTIFFTQEEIEQHPDAADNLAKSFAALHGERAYKSAEEVKRNYDMEGYVRGQMGENNFEPAAKYLYGKYMYASFFSKEAGTIKCLEDSPNRISFDEVKGRIRQTPSLAVSAWTVRVIELLERGNKFREQHCVK